MDLRPGQHAEDSILERVLNPTFGVLQQPIWRIWRALKRDDIDLFSKEGLLDPALAPLFGSLFSQESRVESSELFGDNMAAQIGGSIATDPLALAASGLTNLAKLGKNLGKMQGTELAKQVGKKLGVEAVDEGGERATFKAMLKEVKSAKKLKKTLKKIVEQPDKDGLALQGSDFKVAKKMLKTLDNVDENQDLMKAFAERGSREMGLGLPLVGDLFGKYIPLSAKRQEQFGSWTGLYLKGIVGNTYKTLGKAAAAPVHLVGKAGLRIPLLTPVVEQASKVAEDLSRGLKTGDLGAVKLNGVRAIDEAVDPERYQALLGKEGQGVRAKLEAQAAEDLMRAHARTGKEISKEEAVQMLTDLDPEDYAEQLANAYGPGLGLDKVLTTVLPEEQAIKEVGFLPEEIKNFLIEQDFVAKEASKDFIDLEARQLAPDSAAGAFGKWLRTWHTKLFKNDIGIRGFEKLQELKNHLTSATGRELDTTAKQFYAKLNEVSEIKGVDPEALEKVILATQELSPDGGELLKLFEGINSGNLKTQQFAFEELDQYIEGRIIPSINYLLSTVSENIDESQLKMFEDLYSLLGVDPTKEGGLMLKRLGGELNLRGEFGFEEKLGTVYTPSAVHHGSILPKSTHDLLYDKGSDAVRAKMDKLIERSATALPNDLPLGDWAPDQLATLGLRMVHHLGEAGGTSSEVLTDLIKRKGIGGSPEVRKILRSAIERTKYLDQAELNILGRKISGSDEGIASATMARTLLNRVTDQLIHPGKVEGVDAVDLYSTAERNFLVRDSKLITAKELDELPKNALADIDELDELQGTYLNMLAAKQTLDSWRKSNGTDTLMEIPSNLLEQITDNAGKLAKLVTKTAIKPLGKEGEDLHNAFAKVRTNLFNRADEAGMLPDVVPLGFAHRIKDSKVERAIQDAMGGVAASGDTSLFSPYVNSLFARKNRSYTLRELNLLREQLAAGNTGAAKKAKAIIDNALEAEGINTPAELWRESPVDAMLGHIANIREFTDHTKYYTDVFDSEVAKNNGLIAGRVVSVFDNAAEARETLKTGATRGKIDVFKQGPKLTSIIEDEVRSNPRIGYVVETSDGTQTIVPGELMETGGFSAAPLGRGKDVNESMVDFLRKGKKPESITGQLSLPEAQMLEGQMVSFAPANVNSAVFREMEQNTAPSLAGVLKGYDAVHTTMKLFATGLRFPLQFGTANTLSAVPQGMLTGIGGHRMIQGMHLAARALGGPMDDVIKHDEITSLLALRGGRSGSVPAPRLFDAVLGDRAGGELFRQIDRVGGGIAAAEDLVMTVGQGRQFAMTDIIESMIDAGAWEVRTSGELKNIRSTPELLQHYRKVFMDPGIRGTTQRTKEGALAFAQSTEQFVRLSGMLGGLSAGMDLDTAARAVSDAMVDYSNLTSLEQQIFKRGVFFYTFPRKMVPQVFKKAMENPAKTAAFLHSTIGNEDLFVTSEGRVEMKIDDFRVNMSRLAPQFDAPVMLAAIADILPIDIRTLTGEGRPDLAFTPSGVASIMGFPEFFPTADPLQTRGGDWYDDAMRSNWITKALAGGKLLGSNDPEISYSPLELAAKTFLPFRKVRPDHERERKVRRLTLTMGSIRADLKAARLAGDVKAASAAEQSLEAVQISLRQVKQTKTSHEGVFW